MPNQDFEERKKCVNAMSSFALTIIPLYYLFRISDYRAI